MYYECAMYSVKYLLIADVLISDNQLLLCEHRERFLCSLMSYFYVTTALLHYRIQNNRYNIMNKTKTIFTSTDLLTMQKKQEFHSINISLTGNIQYTQSLLNVL